MYTYLGSSSSISAVVPLALAPNHGTTASWTRRARALRRLEYEVGASVRVGYGLHMDTPST